MHSIRGAVAAALAALCVAAPAALAHEGNPNYRSEVRTIAPALPGLEARVLNYDDRIELVYDGERPLVVEGYRDEPYLRFDPDGRVEVNRRSPAAYLNEDRFAKVELPARADHAAPPSWAAVAENGRYDWHDHRIHWMGEGTLPPQVEDEGERTQGVRLEDPDGSPRAGRSRCAGTLTWLGEEEGGFPVAAGLSLGGSAGGRRAARGGGAPAAHAGRGAGEGGLVRAAAAVGQRCRAACARSPRWSRPSFRVSRPAAGGGRARRARLGDARARHAGRRRSRAGGAPLQRAGRGRLRRGSRLRRRGRARRRGRPPSPRRRLRTRSAWPFAAASPTAPTPPPSASSRPTPTRSPAASSSPSARAAPLRPPPSPS